MTSKELRRRILELVAERESTGAAQLVEDATLADRIEVSVSGVQKQLDILEHEGLVNLVKAFGPNYAVKLTPAGWKALEVEKNHEAVSTMIGVTNVWNFYNTKIDNLVQNVGNNVTVSQVSMQPSLNEIFDLVDKMVAAVQQAPDVHEAVKNDYAIEAEGLKGELRKSRINLRRLREMLAFLGDVDGTLGLALRVVPWFSQLQPYIANLLDQIGK